MRLVFAAMTTANTVVALRHVEVLLDPDKKRHEQVEMPEFLGSWVRGPDFELMVSPRGKRSRLKPIPRLPSWRFELSEAGIAWAAEWRRVSDAANESMGAYLEGEHANCFPGAFRDGFARGAAWARREAPPSTMRAYTFRDHMASRLVVVLASSPADALEIWRDSRIADGYVWEGPQLDPVSESELTEAGIIVDSEIGEIFE